MQLKLDSDVHSALSSESFIASTAPGHLFLELLPQAKDKAVLIAK